MKQQDKKNAGRREFLRTLGMGAAGAAAVAATPIAANTAAAQSEDPKRKSRYKESDHIKTYYRVNRYPS